MLKVGDHVIYHASDYEGPAVATYVRAREGDKGPLIHLAFVHPKRADVLSSSNWREAFDRRLDVEHQYDAPEGQAYYTIAGAEVRGSVSVAEVDTQTNTITLDAKPSAADLDAVAAEQKAAEETQ